MKMQTCFGLRSILFVLTIGVLLLTSSGHSVIAIDRELAAFCGHQGAGENNNAEINHATLDDEQDWVGYWKQDGAPYYLRITKTRGGDLQGQLTHDENIGRVDEQFLTGRLVDNTWAGVWKSFPGAYRELDAAGNTVTGREGIRRGNFRLTLISTNRIEGAQVEGQNSLIHKGSTWVQKFDRCPKEDCSRLEKK